MHRTSPSAPTAGVVQALPNEALARASQKWDIVTVRRVPASGEKPLHWVGSSKRDLLDFPKPVQEDMGNALGIAQFGGTAPSAKPWKGLGSGVLEVVESHDGNAYRAVYTVRLRRPSTCCTPSRRSLRLASGRQSVTSTSLPND